MDATMDDLQGHFDRLPHPYRFLNKIVQNVLAKTFEEITHVEKDTFLALQRHEKRDSRLPRYPPTSQITIDGLGLPERGIVPLFRGRDRLFVIDRPSSALYAIRPSSSVFLGRVPLTEPFSSVAVSPTLRQDDLLVFGTDPSYYLICSTDPTSNLLRGYLYQDGNVPQSIFCRPLFEAPLSLPSSSSGTSSLPPPSILISDDGRVISVVVTRPVAAKTSSTTATTSEEESEGENEAAPTPSIVSTTLSLFEIPPIPISLYNKAMPKAGILKTATPFSTGRILSEEEDGEDDMEEETTEMMITPRALLSEFELSRRRVSVGDDDDEDARVGMSFLHNVQLVEELRSLQTIYRMSDLSVAREKYFVKDLVVGVLHAPASTDNDDDLDLSSNIIRLVDIVRLRKQGERMDESDFIHEIICSNPVTCLETSSEFVGIGLTSGTILLFRSTTRVTRLLRRGRNQSVGQVTAIAFFGSKHVLAGYGDGMVRLYDVEKSSEPVQTISSYANLPNQPILSLCSFRHLPIFLCETPSFVDVIDIDSGEGLGTLDFGRLDDEDEGRRFSVGGDSVGSIVVKGSSQSPSSSVIMIHHLLDVSTPSGLPLSYPAVRRAFPRRSSNDQLRTFITQTPHRDRNRSDVLEEFMTQPGLLMLVGGPEDEKEEGYSAQQKKRQGRMNAISRRLKSPGDDDDDGSESSRRKATIRFNETTTTVLARKSSTSLIRKPQFLTFADMKKQKRVEMRHRVNVRSVRIQKAVLQVDEDSAARQKRISEYLQQRS